MNTTIEDFEPIVAFDHSGDETHSLESYRYVPRDGAQSATDTIPDSLRQNWTTFSQANLTTDLRSRIFAIACLPNGWGNGDGLALSGLSTAAFLKFWREIAVLKPAQPFLTLTFSGHLQAEWHSSWKRHLQIEFVSNEKVIFTQISGDDEWQGRTSVAGVVDKLKGASRPLKWRSL